MKINNSATLNSLEKDLIKAQELSFAKVLSGNDKRLRDRAIKKLKKWLSACSQRKCGFTEEDFQRIWTGLFYCMWMSDKFLVQEEVAERISSLIHCFKTDEAALKFIKCFNKIMALEWTGLDQHRLDKFNMLIRRFLRQSLEYCKRKDWNESLVIQLIDVFEEIVLNEQCPQGYMLHFIDIYPEELAKVSRGKLSKKMILLLFEPFIKLASKSKDARLHNGVAHLFDYLIKQTNVGIEYEEKLNAWKQQGFPSKRPEELERCESEDEESEQYSDVEETISEGALDPRAGNVDTVLPQIPIDFKGMLELVKKYRNSSSSAKGGKRLLKSLEIKFMKLRRGKMPANIMKPSILNENLRKRRHTESCAKKLIKFTESLRQKEYDEEHNSENSSEFSDDEYFESNHLHGANKKIKVGKRKRCNSDTPNGTLISPSKKSKLEVHDNTVKNQTSSVEKVQKATTKKQSQMGKITSEQFSEGNILKPTAKRNNCKKLPDASKKLIKEKITVEKVTNESDRLKVNLNSKRKTLNQWEVSELKTDSEEYNKIHIPKIIKLETKGNSPKAITASENEANNKAVDVSPLRSTPQTQLTPAFWQKAKAKAAASKEKKNKGVFLNPFFSAEDRRQSSKKISFALDKNEAQENEEYLKEVKNSPSIPFDGSKKPIQSALKSGLAPSPINPFYRFKKK